MSNINPTPFTKDSSMSNMNPTPFTKDSSMSNINPTPFTKDSSIYDYHRLLSLPLETQLSTLEARTAGIVIIMEANTDAMTAAGMPPQAIDRYLQQATPSHAHVPGLIGHKKFMPGILGVKKSIDTIILARHHRAFRQQLDFETSVRFARDTDILFFPSIKVLRMFLNKSDVRDLRPERVNRIAVGTICAFCCKKDLSIAPKAMRTLFQALRMFSSIKVLYLITGKDCRGNAGVVDMVKTSFDTDMLHWLFAWKYWNEKLGIYTFARWIVPEMIVTDKRDLIRHV